MKTLRNALSLAGLGLASVFGIACSSSSSGLEPLKMAAGLTYANPPSSGYRFELDPSSRGSHLVLNLIGPTGQSKGVGFTLVTDSTQATWTLVSSDYVQNLAFNVDPPPPLLAALPRGDQLLVGVFQKGGSAVTTAQTLVQVALAYNASTARPTGTAIPLSIAPGSAKSVAADGTVVDIGIGVGILTAE